MGMWNYSSVSKMASMFVFACIIELSSQKHLTREDEGLNFQCICTHRGMKTNLSARSPLKFLSTHSVRAVYIAVARHLSDFSTDGEYIAFIGEWQFVRVALEVSSLTATHHAELKICYKKM
jgi:hypothetical protein